MLTLVLNTIFLDAAWENVYESIKIEFAANDGVANTVPGFGLSEGLPVSASDDLTVVEIPYSGGDPSMLIILPNQLEEFELSRFLLSFPLPNLPDFHP